MQQKMELIRQIRAMEAVPVNRNKLVDLSATAGHGLLSEMSIAEVIKILNCWYKMNWNLTVYQNVIIIYQVLAIIGPITRDDIMIKSG